MILRRSDFEWSLVDALLVPVALFFIWRGYSTRRRTKAHSIPRVRVEVVKAHGRRQGDWITLTARAGWMVPTLHRLKQVSR